MESSLVVVTHIQLLEMLLAAFLGMLLGAERSVTHRTAGMRTYGLVSMGSCLFIVTALTAMPFLIDNTRLDIMRVFAGVISGIGFLGAGVIIFKSDMVEGVTTAAGIWIAAGIGVAVAFGFYALAIFTTLLTLLIFTLFSFFEEKITDAAEEAHIDFRD